MSNRIVCMVIISRHDRYRWWSIMVNNRYIVQARAALVRRIVLLMVSSLFFLLVIMFLNVCPSLHFFYLLHTLETQVVSHLFANLPINFRFAWHPICVQRLYLKDSRSIRYNLVLVLEFLDLLLKITNRDVFWRGPFVCNVSDLLSMVIIIV